MLLNCGVSCFCDVFVPVCFRLYGVVDVCLLCCCFGVGFVIVLVLVSGCYCVCFVFVCGLLRWCVRVLCVFCVGLGVCMFAFVLALLYLFAVLLCCCVVDVLV